LKQRILEILALMPLVILFLGVLHLLIAVAILLSDPLG
jgi:hypothetical protein